MKKTSFALFLLLSLLILLSSCDIFHTHSFDKMQIDEKYLKSEATCTSCAVYYYSCACGAKGEQSFAYEDAFGHSGEWRIETPPSCTQIGIKYRYCDKCGEKETDTIPSDGTSHNFNAVWSRDEVFHYLMCNNPFCFVISEKQPHSFDSWSITKSATCVSEGERQHTCFACGKTVSEKYSDSSAHKYARFLSYDDEFHYKACQNEGCGSKINIAPHSFGNWLIETPATCYSDGVKKKSCTFCNKIVTETVPATEEHNFATILSSNDDYHYYACLNGSCTATDGKTPHTGIWHADDVYIWQECTTKGCNNITKKEHSFSFALQEDGTYKVSDYKGTESEVAIPKTYNGVAVTGIAFDAFAYCKSIKKIQIPEGVTSIGVTAFSYCENLVEIEIPDSVVSIGKYAFWWCKSLTSISIPDNVLKIEDSTFYHCESLKTVSFGEKSKLEAIGNNAFYTCKALSGIEVPVGVKKIGISAFYDCYSLEYVTFKNDSVLETIAANAFARCQSLASVQIPANVTEIGRGAFYWCIKLKSTIFENREGWKAGTTSVSSADLADTSLAATYLKSTYQSSTWKR